MPEANEFITKPGVDAWDDIDSPDDDAWAKKVNKMLEREKKTVQRSFGAWPWNGHPVILRHPGHPDQKVHAGGRGKGKGGDGTKGEHVKKWVGKGKSSTGIKGGIPAAVNRMDKVFGFDTEKAMKELFDDAVEEGIGRALGSMDEPGIEGIADYVRDRMDDVWREKEGPQNMKFLAEEIDDYMITAPFSDSKTGFNDRAFKKTEGGKPDKKWVKDFMDNDPATEEAEKLAENTYYDVRRYPDDRW